MTHKADQSSNDSRGTHLPVLHAETANLRFYCSLRLKFFLILEGGYHPWDKLVQWVILAVIAVNVVLFLLSTVPSVKFGYESLLDYLEAASVYIFMLEFGLRVWVCVEKKKYKDKGPILGRLFFCVQLNSIIDLVSIIPFWVDFGIRMANTDNTIRGRSITQFASAIRVARVFRIFKADKYTKALRILVKVFRSKSHVLLITLVMWCILFLITATALFYAQKDEDPDFDSIPSTFYATCLLLTAQGYYNAPPTPFGKWVVAISNVFSVAVFAIPAGILASGFEPVGEEMVQRKQKKRKERAMLIRAAIMGAMAANKHGGDDKKRRTRHADPETAPTEDDTHVEFDAVDVGIVRRRRKRTDEEEGDDDSYGTPPSARARPKPTDSGPSSGVAAELARVAEEFVNEDDSEFDDSSESSDDDSSTSSYDEEEEKRIVITVKRWSKRIGRVITIEPYTKLEDVHATLSGMFGCKIEAILNRDFGVVGDVAQLQNGKVYTVVTRQELDLMDHS